MHKGSESLTRISLSSLATWRFFPAFFIVFLLFEIEKQVIYQWKTKC